MKATAPLAQRQDIHNSEVPALCRACEARHRGMCGTLSEAQLLRLSKTTTRAVIEPGASLSGPDIGGSRCANILQGVIKLSKLTADGRQQIVGLQFAPDFLGRPNGPDMQVSADAATEVSICSFPRSVIRELVAESPDLESRLHQQALRELDEAHEWMLTLGRKTAAEKVASFILLIATHTDPENDAIARRFEIPLTRADIADFLGLTIETVSRQITRLRQAGVIELLNNREVLVPDIERLRAASETQTA